MILNWTHEEEAVYKVAFLQVTSTRCSLQKEVVIVKH